MTRLEDVTEAIENIKSTDPTNENLKQMQIALLGHIAVSLAVIADKMSEYKAEGETDGR